MIGKMSGMATGKICDIAKAAKDGVKWGGVSTLAQEVASAPKFKPSQFYCDRQMSLPNVEKLRQYSARMGYGTRPTFHNKPTKGVLLR